jgi:hypothetical protein
MATLSKPCGTLPPLAPNRPACLAPSAAMPRPAACDMPDAGAAYCC